MRAFVGLVFGLFAGGAVAADLNDPIWLQAPGREAWAKAYPAHAAQAGISGAVKMKCAATSEGQLAKCAVVEESPGGEGFGAAALSLTAGMELSSTDADGRPVAGRYLTVPVKFEPGVLKPTIITNPDWARRPTAEELANYYPAAAGEGEARIKCVITSRGLTEKCVVESESPAGHGFGVAALGMSAVFLMRPMTRDGEPVGGAQVTIPIAFKGGQVTNTGETIKVLRAAPWMTAPTSENVSAAFPKSLIGKVESAHVVLRCGFHDDGTLKNCETLSATAGGTGFADAAKALTKDFRAYINPKVDKLSNLRVDVPFEFADPGKPAPSNEVYDPIWLKRLNPDAVAQIFPTAAANAGLRKGGATVMCTVQHDGSLKDCTVQSEEPAGLGFGSAALTVASVMAMNPWTAQGTPVDGAHIRLPVRLELPAEAPPPAAAQPTPAKP